jgi:hypothetical protein
MTRNFIYLKFRKKNGKIKPVRSSIIEFEDFIKSLPEDIEFEACFDFNSIGPTKPQIAKVKVCIKELALVLGYTFVEVENLVKENSGLSVNGIPKSFADCSREDLNLAIQEIIRIGDFVGINFR